MKIAAGKFKAECLKLLRDVQEGHEEIIITKFGRPIAKLIALEEKAGKPIFGYLKGAAQIKGNIIKPVSEKWARDETDFA